MSRYADRGRIETLQPRGKTGGGPLVQGKQGLLAAATALAVSGAGFAAHGQTNPAEACVGLPSPAEEIACLRQALQESEAARAGSGEAASSSGGGLRLPRLPFFGGGGESAETASPPQTVSPPQAVVAPDADSFGAEQIPERRAVARQEQSQLHAHITRFEADHRGLLTMELDNGQVWRQVERERIPLRLRESRTYAVELSQSGFGGYRLRFPELERRIAVQRVR